LLTTSLSRGQADLRLSTRMNLRVAILGFLRVGLTIKRHPSSFFASALPRAAIAMPRRAPRSNPRASPPPPACPPPAHKRTVSAPKEHCDTGAVPAKRLHPSR